MLQILTNWLISALAVFIVAKFVPGFTINNFTTALIVALVLGILNSLIKPILLILTLPINILTLGLFTFVISAALIWITAQVVSGFSVSGFYPALIAALALWIINILIHLVIFPLK